MILVEGMTYRESGPLHEAVRQIDPTYKTKHAQYCGASYQVLCFKEEATMRNVQRLIGGRIVLPSDFSKSGEWNGRGSNVQSLQRYNQSGSDTAFYPSDDRQHRKP